MAVDNSLTSKEVVSQFGLDWVLLLFCILTLMFFVNRVGGWLITSICRILIWNQFKISIHIQSFKISLLAGRIFFKNFSIVTKDFTLCILEGNVTWRYWFLNIKNNEFNLFKQEQENGGESIVDMEKNEKKPSRIIFDLDGVEVFVYNRTYAFDYVLDKLKKANKNHEEPIIINEEKETEHLSSVNRRNKSSFENSTTDDSNKSVTDDPNNDDNSFSFNNLFKLTDLLPIDFKIHKGGVLVGNENTASIMVGSFENSIGSFSVAPATNPSLDCYKHLIKFQFEKFQIKLKSNVSYTEPIGSAYLNSNNFNIHEEYIKKRKQRRFKKVKKLWKTINELESQWLLRKRKFKEPSINNDTPLEWKGLPQYLDNEDLELLNHDNPDLLNEEYAIYRTILDAGHCYIVYYFDVPAKVNNSTKPTNIGPEVGNGGDPPKSGVEVELFESTIYYGPWADRQRISFYKAFIPQGDNFQDCQPTEKLNIGDLRIYTFMDFRIKFSDNSSIIRVPMREYSKDLQRSINKEDTDEEDEEKEENNKKPFAWLELKVFENSNIYVFSEYERNLNGNNLNVQIDLQKPELTSSINHNIFYRCDSHLIDLNVNFPLMWSKIIKWDIKNVSKNCEIFLLREHVTLLSDLANDFSTLEASLKNNPSEMVNNYNLFRPYEYNIHWKLIDGLKLYLNINNQNIINNPIDFDDNSYILFQTNDLNIDLYFPCHVVYSKSSVISYSLDSKELSLIIGTPSWNTLNTFLNNNEMAHGTDFKLSGSYTYYNSIELDLVDTIVINCLLSNTTFQAYGFFIKFIMDIKENYFGENIHFQTLEEYTNKKETATVNQIESVVENSNDNIPKFQPQKPFFKKVEPKQIRRIENEIDVLFSFSVDNGCLILPCHLYNSDDNFIAARLPTFDIDIRFTNYYMDLQCDISPLKVVNIKNNPDFLKNVVYNNELNVDPDMFIDGISIHGHRIFGLPPLEPTYVCKWDISTGLIGLNTTGSFLENFVNSLKDLGYTFSDLENSLVVKIPELNDVTIFTFKCPMIDLKLFDNDKKNCLNITLKPIDLKFNDLSNDRYSLRLDLKIKNIILKLESDGKLLFYFLTSLYLSNFCRKKNYSSHQSKQQDHVKLHDGPFHRSPFFLFENNRDDFYRDSFGKLIPSLSLPEVAPPLTNQTQDLVLEEFQGFNELKDDSEIFDDWDNDDESLSDNTVDSNIENSDILEFLPNKKFNSSKPLKTKRSFMDRTYQVYKIDRSEIMPEFDMSDENYEYDNFILNLSNTDVYLSSTSFDGFLKIFDDFGNYSPDTILDNLQIEVLHDLLTQELFTVKNIKLHCPGINLHYGEFNTNNEELFDNNELSIIFAKTRHITIAIDSPSLVGSTKETILNENHQEESRVAMYLPKLNLQFVNEKDELINDLNLNDLEFWMNKDLNLISSVTVKDILINFNDSRLIDLIEYLQSQINELTPVFEKFEMLLSKNSNNLIELFYKLSIASEKFNIDHDSPVLTKPTYIVRNSETLHIRTFDSWRILIRLRHILKSLPHNWQIDDDQWKNKNFAFDKVVRIFANWRSWEFQDIKKSHVFQNTFKIDKQNDKTERSLINFNLNNILLKLIDANKKSDEIHLERIDGEISDNMLDNDLKVSVKIGSIGSRISPISFSLTDLLDVFNKTKINSDEVTDTGENNKSMHLNFYVENFENSINLNKTHHELKFTELFTTTLIQGEQFTSTLDLQTISSEVFLVNQSFGKSSLGELNVNLINSGSLMTGLKVLETNIEKIQFDYSNGSYDYIKFLEIFTNDDLQIVLELLGKIKTSNNQEDPNKVDNVFEFLNSFKIHNFLKIQKVSWNIDVLSPILLTGSILNFEIFLNLINSKMFHELNIEYLSTDFIHNTYGKKFLARYFLNLGKFVVFGNVSKYRPIFQINWNSKVSEFTVPALLRSLNDILNDKLQVEAIIEQYSVYGDKIIKKLSDNYVVAKKSSINNDYNFLEQILFKACIISDVTKFSFNINSSKIELIINESTIIFGNIEESQVKCSIFGSLMFPDSSICLIDPIIPDYLNKIVDISLELKLSNNKDLKKNMEISSEFLKIYLNPFSLVKFLEIGIRAKEIYLNFKETEETINKSIELTKQDSGFNLEEFSKNLSIHILSYNFCFSWIFNDDRFKNGIKFGCERVYIITKETLGKLTIVDGYCSNNNNNENKNIQRALLPNVQLIYAITKTNGLKNLNVNVNGETLDVRLISKYISSSENFIKSIMLFHKLKSQHVPIIPIEKKKQTIIINEDNNYIESLGTVFSSVNCKIKFAGANIRIDRFIERENGPFLNLHSPAIEITLAYKKNLIDNIKHAVRFEFTTFASNNVLESGCVPVLTDLFNGINSMIKANSENNAQNLNSEVLEKIVTDENTSIDYLALMKNVDFNGLINIQPQSLIFSCAPIAKINAVVSTGGIKVQLNTVEKPERLVVGSLLFNELTAKLQHAYSREVSGSIAIGQIMLNMILHEENQLLKIIGSGEISQIVAYVKTSQLQDLNIFTEIWIPKTVKKTLNQTNLNEAKSKTFAEKMHQVSTTNAFPWNVNFAISDVTMIVDLGQQLGVATLLLDQFWLVQRKNSHWEQNLSFGFDSLEIKCVGRLTADFILRNSRVTSVIMWQEAFEIPLVFLSGGVESLEIVVEFDYHTILVANTKEFSLSLFNQRDQDEANLDRLFGTASIQSVNIYVTCLTASNFVDIINSFMRIMENSRSSYKEVLIDGGNGFNNNNKTNKVKKDFSILEKFTNLKTEVGVSISSFLLQIYPSSLMDVDVLVIDSGRLSARYIRRLDKKQLSSSLKLQWNNLDMALSKLKTSFIEKTVTIKSLPNYIEHSSTAKGGTIFTLPLISIFMETNQMDKIINYKYNSSFGGNVDIRWNLGSINFIRTMFETHEKSLSSRILKKKHLKTDTTIMKKVEDVEHDEEYTYIAIEEPFIEPPKLKELGDVTPPLEWFGVHRKNFPALTHHFIILPLEHFVINVEKQYNSVLGKA